MRPRSVLFVSLVSLSLSFYSFFVFFFLVFCLPPYFYFHIFATKEVAGENKKCGLCVSLVSLSLSFSSFFVFFFLVFCLPPYFNFHIFATKVVAGENKKCGLCVSLVPNPNLSVVSGLLAQSQQVYLATGWKILDSDFLTPKLLTQWQPWF